MAGGWVVDLVALALGFVVAISAVVIGWNAWKLAAVCFVVLMVGSKLGLNDGVNALEFLLGVVLGAPIVGVQLLLLKMKNRQVEKAEKFSAAG